MSDKKFCPVCAGEVEGWDHMRCLAVRAEQEQQIRDAQLAFFQRAEAREEREDAYRDWLMSREYWRLQYAGQVLATGKAEGVENCRLVADMLVDEMFSKGDT